MKVAVVGGGIVGLSAARELVGRGHDTTLFEQFPMFHERGSSHGKTRIVRRAYPDPYFTAIMTEAYPLWGELELDSGRALIQEVGLLYFGDRDSERVKSMQIGLSACAVPYSTFEAGRIGRVFPGLRLGTNEMGIFTPEAGWVDAAGALEATYRLAQQGGLKTEQRRVDQATLESSFDAFVVAPGGWIRDWVDVPVRVTLETFGYAQTQISGPVWIDDTDFSYGFPSDALGLKLGAHLKGDDIDPARESREPNPLRMKMIEAKVRERFGLEVPVRHWKGCLYTSTANEDFLFGHLGASGFFASACSGHGFKTGPWVGRQLANFVERKAAPTDFPRFLWPG